jgi:CSLREA domain-containing protein
MWGIPGLFGRFGLMVIAAASLSVAAIGFSVAGHTQSGAAGTDGATPTASATPMGTPPPGTPGPTPPPPVGTPISPSRFDDPAPNGCEPDDCSLREAIIAANGRPGTDTIVLGNGQYDLSLPSAGPKIAGPSISSQDLVYTTPLWVSDDTIVVGKGADRTRVDGEGIGGVLSIQHPTFAQISVQISDLAIQDGVRDGGGGGIYAASGVSLSIDRVSMTGNGGGGGVGGAILSYGPTTIVDSTIADNWAQVGGAIYGGSPLFVTNSTISGNGGISGTGGISSASATLTNVTVTGNTWGGLWGFVGMTVRNSIIAGNAGSQCSGVTSLGHNVSSDDSCNLTGSGDMPSTDPMLGSLADSGGPTQTHALLPGSPAIDAGDPTVCPPADQRGYVRRGPCDIGAFEFTNFQGDVDCMGKVSSVDALLILREVAGLGSGPCAENGDVNCDGNRTSVDALGILRHVASLPISKPDGCPEIDTPL